MNPRRSIAPRLEAALFDDEGPGLDRFGLLLATIVVTLGVLSMVDIYPADTNRTSPIGAIVVAVALSTMLILAARAVGLARRWRRRVVVVAVIALAASLGLIAAGGAEIGAGLRQPAGIWVVLALTMPVAVVRRILRHRRVESSTLLGAICAYLLIAFTFTLVFLEVNAVADDPFFGRPEPTTSFVYFSLTSMTTLGFGDLVATGNLGRLLATSEAVIGQVFLVVLVAALVGRYSQREPE